MSQELQYGLHLDADQMNAFVEGALPAQAREETLAHLAVCAECREVVRLSLPEVEDVPVVLPVRRPWYLDWMRGWNLAWPVAVLAGAIVVGVYVRTKTVREDNGVRVGMVVAPVLPAPPPLAADKAAGGAVGSVGKVGAAAGRSGRAGVGAGRPSTNDEAMDVAAKDEERLPLRGREVTEMLRVQPGVAMPEGRAKAPAPPTVVYGLKLGVAGAPTPSTPAAKASVVTLGSAAPMSTVVTNNAAMSAGKAGYVAPQPPAAGSVSQTVEVQAAGAEMATTDAAVDGLITAADVQSLALLRPLPSGLAAISVASEKKVMVAIDLHNNVFFSKNAGKKWKAVGVEWQGRAVKVEYVTGFALTTDQGGVWVSSDGRSWRKK